MIVTATTVPKVQKWLEDALAEHAPSDAYCLAHSEQAQYATTAISWFPDLDYLETLPNLKLIHSMAAGVEHLNLKRIGKHYAVCRVVDESHQKGMFDYLLWCVLYYQRFFDRSTAAATLEATTAKIQFRCQNRNYGLRANGRFYG